MAFPRQTCEGLRLVVVTEEQRYGPRWVRDNDDDDDAMLALVIAIVTCPSVCPSVCHEPVLCQNEES